MVLGGPRRWSAEGKTRRCCDGLGTEAYTPRRRTRLKTRLKLGAGGGGAEGGIGVFWTNPKLDLGFG